MTHRAGDALGAVIVAEVAAALEEAGDGVLGGGAGDGEVVVGGEHGRVDQGGEERVDSGLVRRTREVFLLGTASEDEGVNCRGGWGCEERNSSEKENPKKHKCLMRS